MTPARCVRCGSELEDGKPVLCWPCVQLVYMAYVRAPAPRARPSSFNLGNTMIPPAALTVRTMGAAPVIDLGAWRRARGR